MSRERFLDRKILLEKIQKESLRVYKHIKSGEINKVIFDNSNKFTEYKIIEFLKMYASNILQSKFIEFISEKVEIEIDDDGKSKTPHILVINADSYSKNLDLVIYLNIEDFFYYKIQADTADDEISEEMHKLVEKINISIDKKVIKNEKMKKFKSFIMKSAYNTHFDINKKKQKNREILEKEFGKKIEPNNNEDNEYKEIIESKGVNDKTDSVEYKLLLEDLISEFGEDYFDEIFKLLYLQSIDYKGKYSPTGFDYFGTYDNAEKKLKVIYRKFYESLIIRNKIQENNGFEEWIKNIMNIEKSIRKNI